MSESYSCESTAVSRCMDIALLFSDALLSAGDKHGVVVQMTVLKSVLVEKLLHNTVSTKYSIYSLGLYFGLGSFVWSYWGVSCGLI